MREAETACAWTLSLLQRIALECTVRRPVRTPSVLHADVGCPSATTNAGRIPDRRGASARSSGIASDAWLLALSAARKKRQLSRHARGYTNAHASPPPTTRTTGRHPTTAAAAAT